MKNLIVELIIGLYGFPYIMNVKAHKSYKYNAKNSWMYSDVFIFDQCRYLYDMVSSIELLETLFRDIRKQVAVRYCIDGIIRNHSVINSNLFKYGYIEGICKEFPRGQLRKRLNVNKLCNLKPETE